MKLPIIIVAMVSVLAGGVNALAGGSHRSASSLDPAGNILCLDAAIESVDGDSAGESLHRDATRVADPDRRGPRRANVVPGFDTHTDHDAGQPLGP